MLPQGAIVIIAKKDITEIQQNLSQAKMPVNVSTSDLKMYFYQKKKIDIQTVALLLHF